MVKAGKCPFHDDLILDEWKISIFLTEAEKMVSWYFLGLKR
jgi:hypothetical protein